MVRFFPARKKKIKIQQNTKREDSYVLYFNAQQMNDYSKWGVSLGPGEHRWVFFSLLPLQTVTQLVCLSHDPALSTSAYSDTLAE